MSSVPWGNETERADWYQHEYAEAYKELERYRNLEAEGRLIELPCKVGDTVYMIHRISTGWYVIAESTSDAYMLALCVMQGRFGKTVFLTKAEAEAKLAELKGGADDE